MTRFLDRMLRILRILCRGRNLSGALLTGGALAAVLFLAPAKASAATYTVDRLDDTNAAQGCADATPNDCSLRGAISKANGTVGIPDTIVLPAGVYKLTLPGTDENGNATGDLDVLDDLTIIGAGPAATFIQSGPGPTNPADEGKPTDDGASHGIDRVISINPNWDLVVNFTIKNATVRYGNNKGSGDYGTGGGIDMEATPFVAATPPPGTGNLTIENCIITNNVTNDGAGAGVSYIAADTQRKTAKLTVKDSQVVNNNGINYGGGGGIKAGNAWFEITGTTIAGNQIVTKTPATQVTYGAGLAANVPDGTTSVLSESTISGNTLTDTDDRGAGAYIGVSSSSVLSINNTTFSGNKTGGQGGGLWVNGGTPTFRNVTFTGNEAGTGGGIYFGNSGTLTLYNSIVWGNTASTGADIFNAYAGANNLIGINPGIDTTLADNGGRVKTHKLLPGSAAIDTGANAQAVGTTDGRGPGFARIVDGDGNGTATVDIGAFELQAADLTVTKTHVGNWQQGQVDATYTITVSNLTATPTSGTVQVVDTLPTGLTNLRLSGTGWTCNNATATCTRSDSIASGAYPAITATVDVQANAPVSVVNRATVSGGGDVSPGNNFKDDTTKIFQNTSVAVGAITATYGQQVSLSATVSPKVAGTVTFSVNGAPVGSAAVNTATGVAALPYNVAVGASATPYSYLANFNPQDTNTYNPSANANTLTVNKAPLTVTANSTTRTYGAANPPLTVSYSGFVLGENATVLGGSLDISTTATTASPVTTYPITVAGYTSANYAITYVPGTLTVAPAPLTIKAVDTSKTYGDVNPTFTATYTGFVLGETEAVLGGTLTFTTTATQSSPVTTYTVTPGGRTASNYAITYQPGTLTVNKATLTVTAHNDSRLYGAVNPAFAVDYSGFVLGETEAVLGGTLSFATAATQTSPVGPYAVTPSGLLATNYSISFVPGTLSVTPAPLTVKANDNTRHYGYPDPAFTATFSGLVAGDTPASLGTLTYSTDATATSVPGTYTITPSGLTTPNYDVTYAAGVLTVDKAPLTVTANNASKVYGEANPAFTVSYTGLVTGETPAVLGGTLSFATAADETSPVGPYTVTPSGLTATNYLITFAPGTLTVGPAPLTITAVDANKTYGEANPTFTASYTGFVNGDTATVFTTPPTFSTPATNSSPVGTYSIIPSGAAADNYTISYQNGRLTVEKALLTVTARDASRLYGAANPAFAVDYSGFVLSDTAAVVTGPATFSTAATTNSPVGFYPVTPGGLTADNYTFKYVDGTLQVTPAPLSVTANDNTRHYGYPDPTYTATYSGLVAGDTAGSLGTVTFTTDATATSVPGDYTITPSGLTTANYTVTYTTGTLTVTKAPLTVKANDVSKVYGQANPALTVSYTGFVNGESEQDLGDALSVTTTADETSPVGSYTITPSGYTSANYAITFQTGTLTVTKAPLKITAVDATKTYGEPNPTFAATYEGFVNNETELVLTDPPQFTTVATLSSGAGQYAIIPSGAAADNYTISYENGRLTVEKAVLTVTAAHASKTYGEPNPAFTVSYSGFVLTDTPAVLGGTLAFATDATQSSPVAGYPVTPGGLTAANYTFKYVDGTLTVNKAPLTVTAVDASRTYGADNPTFAVTYSGFVLNETEAVLGGVLAFDTPAQPDSAPDFYPITPKGLTANNYAITFVDGTLTVTKAPLTVKADDKFKLFGVPVPVLTASFTGLVLNETPAVLGGTLTLGTTAVADSPVGTYPITVSGLTSDNYAITFVNGMLSVAKGTLTIRADDKARTYGDPNPALTVTYNGFMAGDTPAVLSGALSVVTTATESSPVGTYSITPSGLTAANYDVVFEPGVLTVNKRPLTIQVFDDSRYYGDPNPSFTSTVTGALPGDGLWISYTTPARVTSPVGRYPINPHVIDPNGRVSNYDVHATSGDLTVQPAPLTVRALDADRPYGAANPTFAATFTGLRNGDQVAVALVTDATRTSPVGAYPIRVQVTGGAGNYTVTTVDGTLRVTPAVQPPTPPTPDPEPPTPICGVQQEEGSPVTQVECRADRDLEEQVLGSLGRDADEDVYLVAATGDMAQEAVDHAGTDQAPRLVLNVGYQGALTGGMLQWDAVDIMARAGGDVAVQTPYGTLLLPAQVLSAMGSGSPDDSLVVLFEEQPDAQVPGGAPLNAVSPIVSVTLTTVHGDGSVTKHEAFGAPVTLTLPVTGQGDLELAGIYRFNADGTVTYVGGEVDPATGTASVPRDSLSVYGVLILDREYADVSPDHWAYRSIQVMTARHVVQGVSDTQYDPERAVTRAEFATMVARAFGVKVPATPVHTFADVAPTAWYAPVMSAMVEAGLFEPEAGNTLRPDVPITREEMAVVIARAMERVYPGKPLPKPDVDAVLARFQDHDQVAPASRDELARLVEAGLLKGRAADLLAPQGTTTRAEAVTLIKRLLDWGKAP